MTAKDIAYHVRMLINDTDSLEYTDVELLNYINWAIDYIGTYLITAKSPLMVKEITLKDGEELPDSYVSFVGQYPIVVTAGVVSCYTDDEVTVRMFCSKPVIAWNDDIPFPTHINPVIEQLVAIYALNRNEFDLTTDSGLFQKVEAVMAGVFNG